MPTQHEQAEPQAAPESSVPSPQPTVETAAEQAPRSSYELPNRRNTSVRNMVWALVVIMVGVAAAAVAFFGVGTDLGREVPETSQLNVAESAERARDAVDFPVAEPALGTEWTAREARLSAADPASWEIEYTAPSGSLIALEEQAEVGAPMLSEALPGTVVEMETTIDGADCQVLSSETEGQTRRGMSCQGEGWGILVHGDVEDAELRELMEAAIASLD